MDFTPSSSSSSSSSSSLSLRRQRCFRSKVVYFAAPGGFFWRVVVEKREENNTNSSFCRLESQTKSSTWWCWSSRARKRHNNVDKIHLFSSRVMTRWEKQQKTRARKRSPKYALSQSQMQMQKEYKMCTEGVLFLDFNNFENGLFRVFEPVFPKFASRLCRMYIIKRHHFLVLYSF